VSWLDPLEAEPCVAAAVQAFDRMADRLEHALHLMLTALVDRELDP
jgi:hypothetical protein